MQTVSERIEALIEALKMNQNSFSKALGYSNNNVTIGRIIADRNKKPSFDTLEKILRKFPQINPAWLLTGSGPMLIEGNNSNAFITNPKDVTTAPLISQYAYAGYLSGFSDHDYLEAQPHYVAARRHNGGHYVAFEVRGDSMDDGTKRSICEGDILLGRELRKDLWLFRLHIPKVFVIVHRTDGICCKEVIAHDVENGIITCHSWNPDPEYQDFELNMRDILQLFYVKEVSRNHKY
jgi:hypothetical protein